MIVERWVHIVWVMIQLKYCWKGLIYLDLLASVCYVLVIKEKAVDNKHTKTYKKINDSGLDDEVIGIMENIMRSKTNNNTWIKVDFELDIQWQITGAINDVVVVVLPFRR